MALSTFLNQLSPRLRSIYFYCRSLSIKTMSPAVLIAKTEAETVPKVNKIVVKFGIGDADQKAAMNDLELITGQRPIKRRAKNAMATFKMKQGQTLGVAVTLRGNVMYSFLVRLVNMGLPSVWDFGGVSSNSFDGNGNYSIRFHEQSVFPEISHDVLGKSRGMDVCISKTAATEKEAYKLLALMGMPFREGAAPVMTNVMQKKRLSLTIDSKAKSRQQRSKN